jgi:ATP-dependent helicase/nuclease subunit B
MILSKSKIKSVNLDQLVNDYIEQDKLAEILIIVPTNRKIRYLKRELILLSPKKAVTKLNLYTLGTFATKIFQSNNFNSAKVLSDASAAVLLNKSFKETELKYFSHYRGEIPRGTLDRIKNVISEYKRNGILPDKILYESRNLDGSEALKAKDIANIYKNYLLNCEKLNAYEMGDVYSSILSFDEKEYSRHFKNNFSDVKKIIINGFDEFTLPEIDIIDNTAKINSVELFVVFDYYLFNPALFSHLDSCYKKLKNKGFDEIEDTSPIVFKVYQKKIREKIFLLDERDSAQNSEINITKITASSPEEEVRLIAKEIKQLILRDKVQPDSICVIFNLISGHSAIVRDNFDEYGIPFNLTDRFALSESQPIIALINFLEILQNNFYYKNIFRALTGSWIKLDGVELSNLLRVSSNLKVVSGYSNWVDSIERVIEENRRGDEDNDNHILPTEYYLKAKDDIEKINKFLKPFRDKVKIDEFLDSLRKLIFSLKLSEKILNDNSSLIEKNIKALTTFLEIVDEIFDLIIQENGRDKKYSLEYFLTQIKTALQFTRYNIKERHGNGVLVTSVNEIRGLSFDYVFIGGLVDGEFPTRYQPEIFFSGSFKKDEYKHILEERYHFYQSLCSVNKALYISFALKDERKEFTPSTFINDFSRIFLMKEKSNENYSQLVQSKAELLKLFPHFSLENMTEDLSKYGIDVTIFKSDLNIDMIRQKDVFTDSPYTGSILSELSEEAKSSLAEQKERQYSASQLEEYAKCPFQYFLKRILKLEAVEEPTEELEAFELGSIVHSILYEFYQTINEKNIILSNCNEETFQIAVKTIFSVAESKIDKLRLSSSLIFFERERILGIAGNKKNSILYKFLEEERKEKDGFKPKYFELEFGKFDNLETDDHNEVLVGNVKVRGKIDRIDTDEDRNYFKVIDYKLGGKRPSKKDIETGISLQLPLYVYASKKIIEAEHNKNFDPAAAIIYSLRMGKNEFGEKKIYLGNSKNPKEEELIKLNEELINICNEFIPTYIEKITQGKFNLSQLEDRENKVCRFCDFKSICRIQEAK